MKEYRIIKLKDEYYDINQQYPYILDFYTNKYQRHNAYHKQQYQEFFEDISFMNEYIENMFKNRKDYKKQENLHCVKNELTKEISIIIINRYQIIAKCDKISNVLIDTLLSFDSNFIILDKVS